MRISVAKQHKPRTQGTSSTLAPVRLSDANFRPLRFWQRRGQCDHRPTQDTHTRKLTNDVRLRRIQSDESALQRSAVEDPMAPVQVPEDQTTKKTAGRRLGRRDAGRGAGQARGVPQEPRGLEAGDAHRGRDAAQGQVHHVRPQGEEV
ncbi:hypothetical protein TruAng_010977 [Truncatella angustata]|nr:hypothetical protein TruAng_010977 [Truncatella angustata]